MALASEVAADEAGHRAASAEAHGSDVAGQDRAERVVALDERGRRAVGDGVGLAVGADDDVARRDRHGVHAGVAHERLALRHEVKADEPLHAGRQQVGDLAHGRHGEPPGLRALRVIEKGACHPHGAQRLRECIHRAAPGEGQRNADFRQSLAHARRLACAPVGRHGGAQTARAEGRATPQWSEAWAGMT